MGERLLHTQEVGGSKPPAPTQETRRSGAQSSGCRRKLARHRGVFCTLPAPGHPLSSGVATADTVAMSKWRTRIFGFAMALVIASLGLVGALGLPVACGLDGWDDACDPSRVDVLGMWVFRPVAVASSIVIGALLGAAIGIALSRVSNRAYLATGLGLALGSALFVTSRVMP